jgi:hypothetical protein
MTRDGCPGMDQTKFCAGFLKDIVRQAIFDIRREAFVNVDVKIPTQL